MRPSALHWNVIFRLFRTGRPSISIKVVFRLSSASNEKMSTTPVSINSPVPDEVKSAHDAGLRYVIPKGPGIRRQAKGDDFVYLDSHDQPVDDPETLNRIRSLVIPPAWTSV